MRLYVSRTTSMLDADTHRAARISLIRPWVLDRTFAPKRTLSDIGLLRPIYRWISYRLIFS